MPTTIRRALSRNFVLGVDGCHGGWVFVRLGLGDGAVSAGFEPDFGAIINGAGAFPSDKARKDDKAIHLTDGAGDARGPKMEIWS